jgi:hypothetical protein
MSTITKPNMPVSEHAVDEGALIETQIAQRVATITALLGARQPAHERVVMQPGGGSEEAECR